MFDALARLADRRARRVVISAAIAFVAAGALGGSVADRLDPYGAEDPDTESARADQLIEDAGFRETSVVVLVEDTRVSDPADRRRVAELARELESRPDVAAATGYPDTRSRDFVSRDGDATFLAVALRSLDDGDRQDAAEAIEESLADRSGISVGGTAVADAQLNDQVESDLQRAELIAFPLLFLLSLLFFRSVVAALLPLMIGALAIVGTFALLRAASEVGSISVFALNLTTGLGLGLAIDYSLFVVSRYREEIARTGSGLEAMRHTMATAGRTVLFSSLTVAAALASLLLFPQRFLYSMGMGGAMVALLAALITLTVLPAVLALLGERVNSLAPRFLQRRAEREARPASEGFWYRLSRFVMRRPVPIATVSATLLVVAGIPLLGIEFTAPDAQTLPRDLSARQVDDTIRAEFPPFRDTPIEVVVEGGGSGAAVEVAAEVERAPGVAAVDPPRRLSDRVSLIEAVSANAFVSDASRDTVERIRAVPSPPGSDVLVSGQTARFLDFQDSLGDVDHIPVALAIVVGATLLILFLMTGSAILPVKALVMNVLNLSAVFGLLVVIFQDGRLEGLLDYSSQGAIDQTEPILIFAVAFGLSTDYAVFLLSRIKEARDAGAPDREAVAMGLERTGRIVTSAAVLFAIAIGAFATSELVFIKEYGIGVALAVLIDATIVRALLVPSLMELLGRWNWWAPGALRRLHRRVGLAESGPRPERT